MYQDIIVFFYHLQPNFLTPFDVGLSFIQPTTSLALPFIVLHLSVPISYAGILLSKLFIIVLMEAGKAIKVVLINCMHKLIIILDAMAKSGTDWQSILIAGLDI